MSDKCFCHFNGYEVKDALARRQILALVESGSLEGVGSTVSPIALRDGMTQHVGMDAETGNLYTYLSGAALYAVDVESAGADEIVVKDTSIIRAYATIRLADKFLTNDLYLYDVTTLGVYADSSGNSGKQYTCQLIAKLGGSSVAGMTDEQIAALDGLFRICAYTVNAAAAYAAFQTAFGLSDSHSHSYTATVTTAATCTTDGVMTYVCSCGDTYTEAIAATGHNYVSGTCTNCGEADPDYSEDVTLSSIAATYSGGSVTAGTALDDLTGITVTATYSDGSTATVTGYTLSGTIAEGENTITVSYGGMTTTFTVTGVAESGEVETETLELVYATSYPNTTTFAYTESTSAVQYAIAKQGSIRGGVLRVDYDTEVCNQWNLNLYVFDADGNPYCQTDTLYSGNNTYYYWGQNELPGWEDVGAASGFGYVYAPFEVQIPENCTVIACLRRGSTSTIDGTTVTSNSTFAEWAVGGGITFTVTAAS